MNMRVLLRAILASIQYACIIPHKKKLGKHMIACVAVNKHRFIADLEYKHVMQHRFIADLEYKHMSCVAVNKHRFIADLEISRI